MDRYTTAQGLRSIFRILKARRLVFVNPTDRLRSPRPVSAWPAPVDLDRLRADLDSDAPATVAITALLAFHAERIYQLRQLRLTDLPNGHLHTGDQVIRLAEPVRTRLRPTWTTGSRTWPDSINPHLFIHVRNYDITRPATPLVDPPPTRHVHAAHPLRPHPRRGHVTGSDIHRLIDLSACPSTAPIVTSPPLTGPSLVARAPRVRTGATPSHPVKVLAIAPVVRAVAAA
jgi:hypothetical protein